MAVLTWRNVEAPSFRDSADGIRVAGAMFDRAAGNLSQGLGQFQDWRQNQTAGALLNNAQGYTDPEELRKAIASGAVFNDVDRSLVTPQALAALNAQSGTLLDQGVTAEGLRFAKQVAPYKIDNARLTNEGLVIKNDHDFRMSPLLQDQTIAGTANTRANTANTLHSLDRSKWNFGNEQTAYADTNAATAFAVNASVNSMTRQDVPSYFASPEFQKLSPKAKTMAIGILQARFGGDLLGLDSVSSVPTGSSSQVPTSAPAPTSVPVPTGSAPASAVNNLTGYKPSTFVNSLPYDETRKYVPNILSKTGDLSGLSIYEKAKRIMPHLISTESSNDPNAVNKKTADDRPTGLTQIKPSTFAEMKKNYGIEGSITDPKSNVKAGEMYLKELLTKYDGDPEKALAAYNMGMGNLKTHLDKTGNTTDTSSTSTTGNPIYTDAQLKDLVNRSGLAAEISKSGINALNSQNNANSLIPKYANAIRNVDMDISGAVKQLQQNPFYASTPISTLKVKLEELMKLKGKDGNGGINAATAAAILEQNIKTPNWGSRNLTFGLMNYSDPNMVGALQDAQTVLQGDMLDSQVRNIGVQNVSEKLVAAKTSLEAASAQYSAALRRDPPLPANTIDRYRAQVSLAQKALETVMETQQKNYQPNFNKPDTTSPPSPSGRPRAPLVSVPWRGTIPRIPVE